MHSPTNRPFSTPLSLAAALILGSIALSACNTIEGAGKDIQSAGEKIESSAEKNNK